MSNNLLCWQNRWAFLEQFKNLRHLCLRKICGLRLQSWEKPKFLLKMGLAFKQNNAWLALAYWQHEWETCPSAWEGCGRGGGFSFLTYSWNHASSRLLPSGLWFVEHSRHLSMLLQLSDLFRHLLQRKQYGELYANKMLSAASWCKASVALQAADCRVQQEQQTNKKVQPKAEELSGWDSGISLSASIVQIWLKTNW